MNKKGISMIKELLILLSASVIFTTQAFAGDDAVSNVELTERVSKIENQLMEKILPDCWEKRISLSGTVEFEAGYKKTDFADLTLGDESSSDLLLAKVELGIDTKIAKHVSGHVLILYEDGEDISVDEGYIFLDGKDVTPLHLKAGKMYVPFGNFESHMISDPLTLDLGETRKTAMEIGFEYNGFHCALYAFNGDIDKDGDESRIDNFGARARYVFKNDRFNLDVGLDWINNIVDSNGFIDIVAEENERATDLGVGFAFRDYVPGIGTHAVFSLGPVTLIGEYISMLKKPEWNITDIVPGSMGALGLSTIEAGNKVSVWNIETGYSCSLGGKETTFAIGIQGSKNAEEYLPEKRYIGAVSIGIFEGTTLALEYCRNEYETNDKADILTAQIAIEF